MNNHQSTSDDMERLLEQAQRAIDELQKGSADGNGNSDSKGRAENKAADNAKDLSDNSAPDNSAQEDNQPKVKLSDIINELAAPDSPVNLDAIKDVQLDVRVVLGETEASLEDVMRLRKGSVVQLDAQSSDPVSIIVNGQVVARGEALNRNGKFCVRLTEKLIE